MLPATTQSSGSARRLFGQGGYRDRAVTVRDIAADAGVSPALVMKQLLSKEKIFAAVQPDESLLTELDIPTPELGRALVFPPCSRAENGVPAPWAMVSNAVLNSPDPAAAKAEIRERYL